MLSSPTFVSRYWPSTGPANQIRTLPRLQWHASRSTCPSRDTEYGYRISWMRLSNGWSNSCPTVSFSADQPREISSEAATDRMRAYEAAAARLLHLACGGWTLGRRGSLRDLATCLPEARLSPPPRVGWWSWLEMQRYPQNSTSIRARAWCSTGRENRIPEPRFLHATPGSYK